MFTNIFLPPGSLSGGSVLVKQLFKLVWPKGQIIRTQESNQNILVICINSYLTSLAVTTIHYLRMIRSCESALSNFFIQFVVKFRALITGNHSRNTKSHEYLKIL